MTGFEPWLDAFWELSTDRPIGMDGPGDIPASSIRRWSADMAPDDAELFRRCIRAMDRVALERDEPKTLTPDLFKAMAGG